MFLAYLIALIPAAIGGVLWLKSREANWVEWLGSTAIAFAVAGIFHFITIQSMVSDEETWSGQVTRIVYHPYWHAKWRELESYECGTPKHPKTCHRWVTKHRDYPEYWTADVSYGERSETYNISQDYFSQIQHKFGVSSLTAVAGSRPNFDHGDQYDHVAKNQSRVVIPTLMTVSFDNRVKAAPSLFSYSKVPESWGFAYPQVDDWNRSHRLVGNASRLISIEDWDKLNAELGPTKWVNLILVGFGQNDGLDQAKTLEAKWIGGKKNDLVLCYGGLQDNGKPSWAYVFGWTEADIVKANLQTILIDNPIDASLLPKIKAEVQANYQLKDWSKFDYITVSPPGWAFLVLLLVELLAIGGFWWWGLSNEFKREGSREEGKESKEVTGWRDPASGRPLIQPISAPTTIPERHDAPPTGPDRSKTNRQSRWYHRRYR